MNPAEIFLLLLVLVVIIALPIWIAFERATEARNSANAALDLAESVNEKVSQSADFEKRLMQIESIMTGTGRRP